MTHTSGEPPVEVQVVDVHTHFIPPFLLEEVSNHRSWQIRVEEKALLPWIQHEEGYGYPVQESFFAGAAKLADMDERAIDRSVLSLTPTLFFYWIDASAADEFCRRSNDFLAEACASSGGRLEGFASLPMQKPERAASELARAVKSLGCRGAAVGTNIEGVTLDDPSLYPVWEAADELRVPIMLHPYYVGPKVGYEDYYLTNTFVNPLDTAAAASRLIFSPVLDRFPNLTFLLVHAGGFLPYQIGRLDHGWSVRPEPKQYLQRPPSEMLDRFYFDTITHNDQALAWLIDLVGEDHVLMGTDLPFDMADVDPVRRLERVTEGERRTKVAGRNTLELLGLD